MTEAVGSAAGDGLDVVVVGGGITGLTAALDLAEAGATVTVVDRRPLGGKIGFAEIDGLTIPTGPDAFLARRPEVADLAARLGLGDELVAPAASSAKLFRDGVLHPIPKGVLGIPSDLDALALSGLISPAGIERARLDLDLPADRPHTDESVGALVRRRLGDEILEWVVDPLLGGINAGDSDRLSVRAGVPQIDAMAQRDSSLLRASATMTSAATGGPVFLTPDGGLHRLLTRLVESLERLGVRFVHDHITGLRQTGTGWSVDVGAGEGLYSDRVVLTIPTPAAASVLDTTVGCTEVADRLRTIDYSSVALLLLDVSAIGVDVDDQMSGVLVPRGAGLTVTAVSFADHKWPWLASPERHLLRVSIGRRGRDEWMALDDDTLLDLVIDDLSAVFEAAVHVNRSVVTRWMSALPQYDVDHHDTVRAIDEGLRDRPGLVVTGAWRDGLGLPACVAAGQHAALTALTQNDTR